MTVDRAVSLPVAAQPSVATLVEYARQAGDAGYDRAWLPETWGRDAVTTLATIAARTDVPLGTSILNVYSRSPALLGQTAATLAEVSAGRFRLGIGPSGPILVEGWHGVEYDEPLRRTREYVEIVQQVLSGETVEYDGEIFSLAGFRLRHDAPDPPPAVDAAGMGPTSVELAGRFADGWHALMLTRDGLADRMEDLRRGADLGNRDPDDVRVTLTLPCLALEDRERARRLVSSHISFYLASMGTFYREALARQGYEKAANEVASEWSNGNRDKAVDIVSRELLDVIGIAGTPSECREQFDSWESIEDIDAISVSFPRKAEPAEIRTTLRVFAPDGDV